MKERADNTSLKSKIKMAKYILSGLFLFSTLIVLAQVKAGDTQIGMASYYSDKFHGSTTAYGEKYNKNILTAAHKTWPKGTIVKVTRNDNGKSVIVRINDRGPFRKGYIIDISRKAAEEIDLIKAGVTNVKLQVIQTPDGYSKTTTKAKSKAPATQKINVNDPKVSPYGMYKVESKKIPKKGFAVQLGVYSEYKNVLKQVSILQSKKVYNVVVSIEKDKNKKDIYKLYSGPYSKIEAATASKSALRKKGFTTCFVVDLSKAK